MNTKHNKDRLLNANFWISEFFILTLSNYYRWMEKWDLTGISIIVLILLINAQYCVLHVKRLTESLIKRNRIIFIESSYIFSSIYTVLGNMFWLTRSHGTHFGFLIILMFFLSPMVIINSKVLKR